MIDVMRVMERTEKYCNIREGVLRSRQVRSAIQAIVEAINDELEERDQKEYIKRKKKK